MRSSPCATAIGHSNENWGDCQEPEDSKTCGGGHGRAGVQARSHACLQWKENTVKRSLDIGNLRPQNQMLVGFRLLHFGNLVGRTEIRF